MAESIEGMSEEDAKAFLEKCRTSLDNLDSEIIRLIAERGRIASLVARAKLVLGLTAFVADRHAEVERSRREMAVEQGADPNLVLGVMRALLEDSVEIQISILGEQNRVDKIPTPADLYVVQL